MTRVMSRPISRRERKHAFIRSQILSRAIDLFSRKGLDEVTVDQIAEAADIGKGTIYNYFATKEDIVVAFMVELEKEVQAKVGRFVASRRPLDVILGSFIRFQFCLKEPYHAFVRVFLAQMLMRTEQFVPYLLEMQKAVDPPLERLFSGLQERGRVRGDVAIAELILVFKTIHMGLTVLWAVEGPPFKQTYVTLKQEMKFFCEGLRKET
jgi:AcrR family transcriptional regulator